MLAKNDLMHRKVFLLADPVTRDLQNWEVVDLTRDE